MTALLAEATGTGTTTIERALDDAIARLGRAAPSAATKTLLIEARRLKGLMASWAAIPPPAEARREMLARVMRVAADAGAATAGLSSAPGRESPPTSAATGPRATVPAARKADSLEPRVLPTQGIAWQASATLPGVASKLLHWDSAQGLFTALVRLDPSAELPARKHAALEELFVLEGSVNVGADELRTHAYCRSEIGDEQSALLSPQGCTLLLVGSERGEVLA